MIRRERNTSRNAGEEVRREIRNKFILKLRVSGYSWKQRLNIMLSGLRGYATMLRNERNGGRKVNRPGSEGAKERRVRKALGKTRWFKNKRKGRIRRKELRGTVPHFQKK